jgi:deoxyribodipyrimidine photo-lyase
VWFRRDLRIADNPALFAASARGQPVIPVYVLEEDAARPLGCAARWWLHHSLKALCRDLGRLGAKLILRRGRAVEVLPNLARECGASTVLWNRRYDPRECDVDSDVERQLAGVKSNVEVFNASLLFEPAQVDGPEAQPSPVFAAFWRRCLTLSEPPKPLERPARLEGYDDLPSDTLADWQLLGRSAEWANATCHLWTPGEDAAYARLADFLAAGLGQYCQRRDHPDIDGTSRLSPYLAFGEIGPRQVWHAARSHGADPAEGFLRELGWREFCHHTLHHFPELPDEPLRPEFRSFPWTGSEQHWSAFIAGYTGYPIVDAAMRALWETGWLHNRLRMIVASFLVKDLLIPWQRGAAWFADTLVDADVANNACGWQWVAGCGIDSAPYFRVFNPVVQAEKFDPRGRYVRRWLPEIVRLSDIYIHRPWTAPAEVLAKAGISLGQTYPLPIIEHNAARRRALMAYERVRGAA